MEGFRIDLKTFLGFAMPNQYSQSVGSKSPNLHNPIYSTTVLYDNHSNTIL